MEPASVSVNVYIFVNVILRLRSFVSGGQRNENSASHPSILSIFSHPWSGRSLLSRWFPFLFFWSQLNLLVIKSEQSLSRRVFLFSLSGCQGWFFNHSFICTTPLLLVCIFRNLVTLQTRLKRRKSPGRSLQASVSSGSLGASLPTWCWLPGSSSEGSSSTSSSATSSPFFLRKIIQIWLTSRLTI